MTGPEDTATPAVSTPREVRVVAVDDHPIVIDGLLHGLTRAAPDITVLGAATTTAALLGLLDELTGSGRAPDLVLMDLHLGDGTDPSARIAQLVDRGLRVVVVTSESRPIAVRRAVQAGAVGLALKADPVEALADTIRTAAAGDFAVSGDLAHALVTDPALTAALARREVEVLALLADGVPRKSLGAHMAPPVSNATAVTYLNGALARYRDLGVPVDTAADAVRAALADGHLGTDRFARSDGP